MGAVLVSVEGISGVGKTTLTGPLLERLRGRGERVLSLEGFAQRAASAGHGLGRDILRSLIDAAGGDHFLRSGHPAAETLLLLAIKTYDYEQHCLPALRDGRLVIEGRSVHSTAVYQSLILHPGDDRDALVQARAILELASHWRPLPDLTLLLADDVATCIDRLERRGRRRCTPEEERMHYRADALFIGLATDDPRHIRVIDRRSGDSEMVIGQMLAAVTAAGPQPTGQGLESGPG
jgi:dTMP kinase